MPGVRSFTGLLFWQRARQWSKRIFKMAVAFISSVVKPGSGVKHLRKMPDWSERIWERYERITGKPRPPYFDLARMMTMLRPTRWDE